MSDEMKQIQDKVIQDLTNEVRLQVLLDPYFPKGVEIREAKLLFNPRDNYLVSIKYQVGGIEYEVKRKIYTNLQETVSNLLFHIKDFGGRTHKEFYRRTHKIH